MENKNELWAVKAAIKRARDSDSRKLIANIVVGVKWAVQGYEISKTERERGWVNWATFVEISARELERKKGE